MKIIKEGIIPEDSRMRMDCHFCRTEFEFTKEESNISVWLEDKCILSVDCPLCSKTIRKFVNK